MCEIPDRRTNWYKTTTTFH